MADKRPWEFDFEAKLPEEKESSPVPEGTWKEIVDEFEESQNSTAKLVLNISVSLNTALVKLRKAAEQTSVEVVCQRHVEGKTEKGHKRYLVDAIFLKKKAMTA
ncbi:MAG: hypothetical protein ABSG33_09345 [Candidatus Bathyarchaeia archaeon]|jgi:hypothetical protein